MLRGRRHGARRARRKASQTRARRAQTCPDFSSRYSSSSICYCSTLADLTQSRARTLAASTPGWSLHNAYRGFTALFSHFGKRQRTVEVRSTSSFFLRYTNQEQAQAWPTGAPSDQVAIRQIPNSFKLLSRSAASASHVGASSVQPECLLSAC